jgi:hypothetical protein
MSNILDAIQVSGASYDLKDKNAPSVSSLTQSEYDNLPSTAKTSNTFFVITDAQGGDLSNYWTTAETQSAITEAVSGKVDTTAIVTVITSSSTDAQVPSAKAVYDQMGGLKLVKLTQSAYDALSPNYDSNTLYVING